MYDRPVSALFDIIDHNAVKHIVKVYCQVVLPMIPMMLPFDRNGRYCGRYS